jgi:acyl carrier protein
MTWTSDKVRDELITLFRAHAQGGVDISAASHLVADLGIDSLGMMEVIADIEDKFELSVPDDALAGLETIGNVVSSVEGKLKAEGRLEG